MIKNVVMKYFEVCYVMICYEFHDTVVQNITALWKFS